MLMRSHTEWGPWACVRNDKKKPGRLNLIRHLVRAIAPKEIAETVAEPDPEVVFSFEPAVIENGRLER
jgi:hypothetical protein